MKIEYCEFKKSVDRSGVFLPYRTVLEEMMANGTIAKLTRGPPIFSSLLEYFGNDIEKDILGLRREHYIVSVGTDNLPLGWLRFNEVLRDLSLQCRKSLSFYVPYYDLKAATYYRDLSKLDIEKNIMLYHPKKHYAKEDAYGAIRELEANGFKCVFSKSSNHAKTYIFDNSACVIGSFNFTDRGIYTNNELGVLLFGTEVETLKSFLDRRESET